MAIADKVFAAREQAKNKPIAGTVKTTSQQYSFLNPTNSMHVIQRALFDQFKEAAVSGGGYELELTPFYATGYFSYS